MPLAQIRLKTENFRAIRSADIILNGITVVAGENGCGKSTLSKLLYYLYKSAANYDVLVAAELKDKLNNITRFLEIVISEIHSLSNRRNTQEEFAEFAELRSNLSYFDEDDMDKWILLIQRVENNFKSQPTLFREHSSPVLLRKRNRLQFIIADILGDEGVSIDENVPFNKVVERVRQIYTESIEKIKSRPVSLFLEELKSLYSNGELPEVFEVYELEDQIASVNKNHLSIPYLIQNTIYIDTPMMFGVEYSNNEYWEDLDKLLHTKGKSKFGNLSNKIRDEIINGNVSLNENSFPSSEDFLFKRSDGKVFNLIDCATGLKSFAMLQLLINNGCLTDKTLLIIDEPESNLHPQWIIEYARMIVLLNKEIGVKFFIASHNPDMVSAIKYIAQKQGVENNLNYYLAEKGTRFMYDYKHLGSNIDPIFASFNIALERIHQYGS